MRQMGQNPSASFASSMRSRDATRGISSNFTVPEPFGLVLIEAMATGTPVIAWRKGSVPKIIDEGVTGFVVNSIGDALRAIGQISGLDRSAVRQQFEARFTASQMAFKYLAVYEKLIVGSKRKKLAKSVPVEKRISIVDDHPLQPLQVNGL
jgi:glycosyltransferase involved in cell wall biosynthesis